jgi:hypothetical protein
VATDSRDNIALEYLSQNFRSMEEIDEFDLEDELERELEAEMALDEGERIHKCLH